MLVLKVLLKSIKITAIALIVTMICILLLSSCSYQKSNASPTASNTIGLDYNIHGKYKSKDAFSFKADSKSCAVNVQCSLNVKSDMSYELLLIENKGSAEVVSKNSVPGLPPLIPYWETGILYLGDESLLTFSCLKSSDSNIKPINDICFIYPDYIEIFYNNKSIKCYKL